MGNFTEHERLWEEVGEMVVSSDWQRLWQKPAKEMGDAMEGLMFLVCIILLNNSDPYGGRAY